MKGWNRVKRIAQPLFPAAAMESLNENPRDPQDCSENKKRERDEAVEMSRNGPLPREWEATLSSK